MSLYEKVLVGGVSGIAFFVFLIIAVVFLILLLTDKNKPKKTYKKILTTIFGVFALLSLAVASIFGTSFAGLKDIPNVLDGGAHYKKEVKKEIAQTTKEFESAAQDEGTLFGGAVQSAIAANDTSNKTFRAYYNSHQSEVDSIQKKYDSTKKTIDGLTKKYPISPLYEKKVNKIIRLFDSVMAVLEKFHNYATTTNDDVASIGTNAQNLLGEITTATDDLTQAAK